MTPSELSTYTDIDLNNFKLPAVSVNNDSTEQPQNVIKSNIFSNTVKVEFSEEIIAVDAEVLCKRCGKPLHDTKSRILGMGPTCYKLYMAERNKQLNLFCCKGIGKIQDNE